MSIDRAGLIIIESDPNGWGFAEVTEKERMLIGKRIEFLRSLGVINPEEIVRCEMMLGILYQPDRVTESEFIQAGSSHGCPVMIKILVAIQDPLQPNRTYEATWWSYITKNRAHRFIVQTLEVSNEALLGEWVGGRMKEGTGSEPITRPQALEDLYILQGLEKVECYWPSQLLRYLEAIIYGRESVVDLDSINLTSYPTPDVAMDDLHSILSTVSEMTAESTLSIMRANLLHRGISEEDISLTILKQLQFALPWALFADVISTAETTEDITVGIALRFVTLLKERNIDPTTIADLLLKGYDPAGPLKEHGEIERIRRIWNRILSSPEIVEIQAYLANKVESKIANLGY